MRKIILSLHLSLDGYAAGPNGEMDWIKIDDEMFAFVKKLTDEADTALYGRVTYQMMDAYWPTAAKQTDASVHDIEHSEWYNSVDKIIISKSLYGTKAEKTIFIGDNIAEEITNIKKQPGKNILIFGSPSATHLLIQKGLIDEYWLFINPVILGKGISAFVNSGKTELRFMNSKTFACGSTLLHYAAK